MTAIRLAPVSASRHDPRTREQYRADLERETDVSLRRDSSRWRWRTLDDIRWQWAGWREGGAADARCW